MTDAQKHELRLLIMSQSLLMEQVANNTRDPTTVHVRIFTEMIGYMEKHPDVTRAAVDEMLRADLQLLNRLGASRPHWDN